MADAIDSGHGGASSLAVIVPRWEWRTFGERFGEADTRFAALEPERVQESDEVYLVSTESDASVKVRDGLMDVKHLEDVNEDGLEQWIPVMKATFPLPAAEVGSVLAALGVAVPPLSRSTYSLDELVDEVVRPNANLLAVPVHKRRERYTLGGCMAELTEVTHGPRDDTDDRGRGGRPVPRDRSGARARAWPLVRTCASPAGSRRWSGSARAGTRSSTSVPTRSSSTSASASPTAPGGRSSTAPRSRAWAKASRRPVGSTRSRSRGRSRRSPPWPTRRARHGSSAIAAVGTAGLRIAANSAELVDAVQARCGVEVEVIPGEEEGRLAYLAAKSGARPRRGPLVVFDTGGGSSQFTFGHGAQRRRAVQRQRRRGPFHGAFGLDGVVTDGRARQRRLDAIAADLARSGRAPRPRRARRDGRRRHQHRRGQARARDLRPGRRPGHGARPRRDRPADRALPHPHRRRPAADRRPAAEAGGSDPRRRLHRTNGDGEARTESRSPSAIAAFDTASSSSDSDASASNTANATFRPNGWVACRTQIGAHHDEPPLEPSGECVGA